MLRKSGDKCCTTIKAMPVSGGRFENSASRGSSPPAEAPIATTRQEEDGNSGLSTTCADTAAPLPDPLPDPLFDLLTKKGPLLLEMGTQGNDSFSSYGAIIK
jgi:hypothetical protein